MSQFVDHVIDRNQVHFHGTGCKTLVLANGFGCAQTVWAPVVERLLAGGDYRVVTFDYPGTGQSDPRHYTVDQYANLHGYVTDLLDVCAITNTTPVVIGHSISASVAMLASVHKPQALERLIAIGPSPHYLNDGDYHGGFERSDIDELLALMSRNRSHWATFMAPQVVANSEKPAATRSVQTQFESGDPYILHRFGQVTFLSDIRSELTSVPIPVDILYNDGDMIVPRSVIGYLGARLPRCSTHKMDANGHYPHVSEPDQVAAEIFRILNAGVAK